MTQYDPDDTRRHKMTQDDTRWHKTTQDDLRMTQVVSNKVFPKQFERSLTILDSNLLKLNLVGYDGKLTLTDLQGDITGDRPSIAVARHRDKVVNVRWAHDLCYVGRWKCWWSCCCLFDPLWLMTLQMAPWGLRRADLQRRQNCRYLDNSGLRGQDNWFIWNYPIFCFFKAS